MMKRFYAFIAALFFSRLVLMAVPAYPVKKIIKLEDGSTVQVTLRGDEFLHYYEAENGLCYKQLADGSFARIKDAGIVGMGGASFPAHVKLNPPADKKIEYVLLNAAECEPYITCDFSSEKCKTNNYKY